MLDKPLQVKGQPLPPEMLYRLTQSTQQDLERAIATASSTQRKFLKAKRKTRELQGAAS